MQVDRDASFVHFVYPFHFDPTDFAERAKVAMAARWPGREPGQTMPIWVQHHFPADDLLPHVANYLNPPGEQQPTARLWEMDRSALSSPQGLGSDALWSLICPKGAVPFRLESVQLILFGIGVGFLTVRARPTSTETSDWFDFVHYFRFADGKRDTAIQAQRRTGKDQVAPFFPRPAGGIEKHPDGRRAFGEVVEALLHTVALPGEAQPWWHEVFVPGQMMPFVALYLDGVAEDEIPGLVYRARNFFHSHQEIHPATTDRSLDNNSALLNYTDNQWFTFSLDGGAFIACNAPDQQFFRNTLPDHLRDDYFLLFLLALHQRFTLMMLSEEVAQHWPMVEQQGDETVRVDLFARLRDSLLSFTARSYFAQVMQREHHHRCYRLWQETFQVERLYREVRDEVQDMHDCLEARRQEHAQRLAEETRLQLELEAKNEAIRERAAEVRAQRMEQRVTQMAAIVGIPVLTLTYVQAAGLVDFGNASAALVGGLALGMLAFIGLTRFRLR